MLQLLFRMQTHSVWYCQYSHRCTTFFSYCYQRWLLWRKNALGAPSHYSSSDTYSQTNVDTLWHLIIKSVPHRTKMKVSSMLLFVHVFTSLRNVIHKHHHSTRYTGKINIMSLLPSVLLECTAMRMATNEWFIIQTYCTFKHSICDL